MSRWRIHLLALAAFLIFPALAVWVDLNSGPFLRWLTTIIAFGLFALYAGATSAAVAIFKMTGRGAVILHAPIFAISLVIVVIWFATGAGGPGAQITDRGGYTSGGTAVGVRRVVASHREGHSLHVLANLRAE
ncbi:MAG: hypothetical protein Q8L48_40075 [Archangium sp.]|nr:hypothetical protein [Archangium sp.]